MVTLAKQYDVETRMDVEKSTAIYLVARLSARWLVSRSIGWLALEQTFNLACNLVCLFVS